MGCLLFIQFGHHLVNIFVGQVGCLAILHAVCTSVEVWVLIPQRLIILYSPSSKVRHLCHHCQCMCFKRPRVGSRTIRGQALGT